MPPSSPGRSTPVGRPKPKRRTHLSKRLAPSLRPIITEPTFDDSASIWATVLVPPPPSCASPTVRSATVISYGTSSVVPGSTSFSSSAPETVKALNVEPGSKLAWMARFWRAYSGAPSTLFASTRGQFASASTWPVRGSSTTAVAPTGV